MDGFFVPLMAGPLLARAGSRDLAGLWRGDKRKEALPPEDRLHFPIALGVGR